MKRTTMTLIVAALLAVPAAVAFHQPAEQFGPIRYAGGASTMLYDPVPRPADLLPAGIVGLLPVREPVAGAVACGGTDQGAQYGGACLDVRVGPGDFVSVSVCENSSPGARPCQDVAFAVCVDGDNNNECRPEQPLDDLHFRRCGDPNGHETPTLEFAYSGPPGLLNVFVMQEVGLDGTVRCPAVGGDISGFVLRAVPKPHECSDGLDNDGNGFIDYPLDPGCTSPDDDTEVRPPPARVH